MCQNSNITFDGRYDSQKVQRRTDVDDRRTTKATKVDFSFIKVIGQGSFGKVYLV